MYNKTMPYRVMVRLEHAVKKRQTAYGHALNRLRAAKAFLAYKTKDLEDMEDALRKAQEAFALDKNTPEMEFEKLQTRIKEALSPNKIAQFKCLYKEGGQDECWPWLGTAPKMSIGGKWIGPRRIAWAIHNGSLPMGKSVFQKSSCTVDICVNPSHLIASTVSEISRMSDYKYQRNGRPRNPLLHDYRIFKCTQCGGNYSASVDSHPTGRCHKCLIEAKAGEVKYG